MHSTQQFMALAALVPFGLALPTPDLSILPDLPTLSDLPVFKSFSVSQVYNPNFSQRNGAGALAKVAAKYYTQQPATSNEPATNSVTTPTGSTGRVLLAGSGDAETSAIDSTDIEYLTPITVGGKQYLLDLDTGSSNLWIGGSNTSAKDPYVPTGKAVSGPSWSVTYGDGSSASGDVYLETVTVGETTVTAVAVGHATQAPASIFATGANGQAGSDGLLGLGFSSANTFNPQQKTWFDTAVAQGLPNVFAANVMPGTIAGSYDFGQIDTSAYSGDIAYSPVDKSSGYWMVTPTKGERGVMDTGTTLIMLSDEGTKAYYTQPAAVAAGARLDSSAGGYVFKCDATMPDFSVTFGNHVATVPGAYMLYSYTDSTQQWCFGGIQSNGGAIPFAIYGDRFLMSQYVIYDQRNGSPQIGFANKATASS